jgi:predicted RNase H-like HicB family nuclease
MSYDPLQFEYHSTPDAWACYYDPEGPVGYGKTREKALEELYELCDHPHGEAMLWGSIVAAIDKPKPMPGEFIPPMHDRSKADMGDINSPLREGVDGNG